VCLGQETGEHDYLPWTSNIEECTVDDFNLLFKKIKLKSMLVTVVIPD